MPKRNPSRVSFLHAFWKDAAEYMKRSTTEGKKMFPAYFPHKKRSHQSFPYAFALGFDQ